MGGFSLQNTGSRPVTAYPVIDGKIHSINVPGCQTAVVTQRDVDGIFSPRGQANSVFVRNSQLQPGQVMKIGNMATLVGTARNNELRFSASTLPIVGDLSGPFPATHFGSKINKQNPQPLPENNVVRRNIRGCIPE